MIPSLLSFSPSLRFFLPLLHSASISVSDNWSSNYAVINRDGSRASYLLRDPLSSLPFSLPPRLLIAFSIAYPPAEMPSSFSGLKDQRSEIGPCTSTVCLILFFLCNLFALSLCFSDSFGSIRVCFSLLSPLITHNTLKYIVHYPIIVKEKTYMYV